MVILIIRLSTYYSKNIKLKIISPKAENIFKNRFIIRSSDFGMARLRLRISTKNLTRRV